jgi:hypothetical protein
VSSFDSYEYAGYIVPGAILLLGLIFLFPKLTEKFGSVEKDKFGLGEIGIFLVIAFTLGHLQHASGHFFDQWPPKSCIGGLYGTNEVVYDRVNQTVLSPMELEKLAKKLKDKFEVDVSGLNLQDGKDLLVWCNVMFRMIGDVYNAKRGALLDTYIRDYGLYLGLAAAFIVLALSLPFAVIFPHSRPGWLVQKDAQGRLTLGRLRFAAILLLLFGATYMALYRLFYFARLYVNELFLQFIAG